MEGWENSGASIEGIKWARQEGAVTKGIWILKDPIIIQRSDGTKVCCMSRSVPQCIILELVIFMSILSQSYTYKILTECFWEFRLFKIALWECCLHALFN